MPLDINMFREEKGADLSILYKSQDARFKPRQVIDDIIAADKSWRESIFKGDDIRKQLKQCSKKFGQCKKNKEDTTALAEEIKTLKVTQAAVEEATKELQKKVKALLRTVGNIVPDDVPVSQDEEKDMKICDTWGTPKSKEWAPYHHHELLQMIDGVELERGVVVAGHRGYFLKGHGVMLNQALINFGLNFLRRKDYTPLQPPYFMNKEVMAETAQLEEFDEALYKVTGDGSDKYLIATSEQPISAMHRGEWLEDKDLPKRYAGISTCFRKEAGSHGKDTWGIFRIHQFEKVEQFSITKPEDSEKMHQEMIETSRKFYQALGLPYRVVTIVSGELNNTAAKKYDLEAWFPTLGLYRELVSASNCTDYQSRAMETRYGQKKMGDRKKEYVHMLNSTLTATERTICCLLENYQCPEGVRVPKCLQPYMDGLELMPFVKPCPPKPKAAAGKKKKSKGNKAGSDKKTK